MKFLNYLAQVIFEVFSRSFNKHSTYKKLKSKYPDIFCLKKVQDGPFEGLIYPDSIAYGSSYLPKVLGTYEKELHNYIYSLKDKKYETIIDIGSAEGYYAVGLKKMFPMALVYAIDINNDARNFCTQMAISNNCLKGFTILPTIDYVILQKIITNNTLIICDCEGYESKIFTKQNIEIFRDCDLVIECHDFVEPLISTKLYNLLSQTHDIIVIQSLDDNLKAKYYPLNKYELLTISEKKFLFAENRPQIMEWLVCNKLPNL